MDFAWGLVADRVLGCRMTFTVAVAELANESTTWRTSVTPPTGPAWYTPVALRVPPELFCRKDQT
jgi:hypothetical protein